MKLLLAALLLLPAAAHAEGMPQLDFTTPLTTSQVVWGAIIFIVLYVLLSRWGLPQVSDVLDARAARVTSDLDAARRAKDEADKAVDELTRATREAHAGAQAQIANAVAEAKAAAEAQAAEINARLEAQIANAEQRIEAARTAALAALEQVAVDTTNAVVTRLVGVPANPQAVPAAVGAVLAARAQ